MQISGEVSGEYVALQGKLKRRSVRLNTLHAALRIPYLDPRTTHYLREREQRLVKLVTMLGGIREPDLVRIMELPQPTLWRVVEQLRLAGALRVERGYRDRTAGARAKWVQPPGSPDLDDERRVKLIETARLIREYCPLWQMECARVLYEEQRAKGLLP